MAFTNFQNTVGGASQNAPSVDLHTSSAHNQTTEVRKRAQCVIFDPDTQFLTKKTIILIYQQVSRDLDRASTLVIFAESIYFFSRSWSPPP